MQVINNCEGCISEHAGVRPPKGVCEACWRVSVRNMRDDDAHSTSVKAETIGLVTASQIRIQGGGRIVTQL